MTKEQNEAIEYFINKIIDAKPQYIETMINGKIIKEEVCQIKMRFDHEESEKMKTILNMLKEKDAEIEKYKKLLADNLVKGLNDSIKAKEKADTDLDDLDKGWKVELEKKDKMIDLMAERINWLCKTNGILLDKEHGINFNEKDIKQYFERKVEDERNKV